MKRYIRTSSSTASTGDFTVIQEIYDDGMAYMTEDNVAPAYTQEYAVNFDEVASKYPDAVKYALRGITDETFNAGDIITNTSFARYVERVIGETRLYEDYNNYVAQHREFHDPCRQVEVRVNNPKCFPSAEEERRNQSEKLGKYLGRKLGLRR